MKQTEGPLSEGCVHIMHKKLRNFHFFERIFTIHVLNVRLGTGWLGSLGRSGQHFAAGWLARFGWLAA
jgi:hypothetical protein